MSQIKFNKFKLAVCQLTVEENKAVNIDNAYKRIRDAAVNGASVIVLPEMFNCPYSNSRFHVFSESWPGGETLKMLSGAAKKYGVSIVGGSIPERETTAIYNTSYIIGPKGELLGKHRKMHLFDIDMPGRIAFKESDTLSRGDEINVIKTDLCMLGVGICYDMRFPELMRLMALQGAELVAVPAAFNMVTGPAHWETLIRARAIDNQLFMAAASPARDVTAGYVAYGNSMIVDPWGKILAKAGEEQETITAEIDIGEVYRTRDELPVLKHRRNDVYSLNVLGKE